MRGELDAYGAGLVDKAEVLALNKIDAVDPKEVAKIARKLAKASGEQPILLSVAIGEGVEAALDRLIAELGPVTPKAEEPDDWSPI